MDEHRRPRRRRGGRGGQSQQRQSRDERKPPGPPAEGGRDQQPAPGGQSAHRQDSRGTARADRSRGGAGSAPAGGRIRRGPDTDRPQRDARARLFEQEVPQDERSIELGARFREGQTALRDARKTLEKRKAEHGDEPQWLLDQYAEAERRFAEVATEWSEHLATTGRKVVRR